MEHIKEYHWQDLITYIEQVKRLASKIGLSKTELIELISSIMERSENE